MRVQGAEEAERHVRPYGQLVLFAGNTHGPMRTEKADLKILLIEPGQATSHHRHFIAESIFHVLEGELEYLVEEAAGQLGRGDTLIVEPGEFHQLRNVGALAARVLEIESPPHDSADKQAPDAFPKSVVSGRPPGRFWRSADDLRVKVCGIANVDAAHLCDLLGVDAIGLHLVGRGRMENARAAERWLSSLPHELSIFLLTDADDPGELIELARRTWCDTVQLQGPKPLDCVARCAEALRPRGWKFVKSIGLSDLGTEALAYARGASAYVDSVLLDASFQGGTGLLPDWDFARRIVDELAGVPVMLAGGLTADNVAGAISKVRPFAVDVESGVEFHLTPRSGGRRVSVRSPEEIQQFLAAARPSVEP